MKKLITFFVLLFCICCKKTEIMTDNTTAYVGTYTAKPTKPDFYFLDGRPSTIDQWDITTTATVAKLTNDSVLVSFTESGTAYIKTIKNYTYSLAFSKIKAKVPLNNSGFDGILDYLKPINIVSNDPIVGKLSFKKDTLQIRISKWYDSPPGGFTRPLYFFSVKN